MRAPKHPQNDQRLETLYGTDILDTEPEKGFDDIVSLAADLCDVPVALVSLVDKERQWFKARHGMDLTETPIAQSVCAHAILHSDLVEIEDTRNDPRTAGNTLLHSDTPLLFYAGVPLMAGDGLAIGTLCVLDYKPRRLTSAQRRGLRTLANQVMKEMDLKQALRNEETLRSEMDHRIKNSLQATSSLVRLYTRAVEDEAAKDALQAVQRRIEAMSALHEQLQSTSTSGTIAIKQYLEKVIGSLRTTTPGRIKLRLECEDTSVPARAATDIGIILSEFIANSIKHGFPGGRTGTVTITLATSDEDKLVLQATDDGIGSDVAPAAPCRISGIGSNIVAAAASNLGGVLTNDLTDGGARLSLVFEKA
ncbi:histidine kinase dimerization/phosphoacceptor domain -containing protein [Sulfitobacter sp. HNIBRBA3233]|uniref:histidine kinase dimerization/phosphoacceptor domain -containing protein n=1 Tax=Sulfitobacter marinivivus TaxID=3158558 RepID=UPI0032DFBA5B